MEDNIKLKDNMKNRNEGRPESKSRSGEFAGSRSSTATASVRLYIEPLVHTLLRGIRKLLLVVIFLIYILYFPFGALWVRVQVLHKVSVHPR